MLRTCSLNQTGIPENERRWTYHLILELIADNRNIRLDDVILISANPIDEKLAHVWDRKSIPKVITIPRYENQRDTFSFERIELGSWKYFRRFAFQALTDSPRVIHVT